MHSYIGNFQFTPEASFKPIDELTPLILKTMSDQDAKSLIGEGGFDAFKDNIVKCMKVYYGLLGITDEVIASNGMLAPQGVLQRYTQSLIEYFELLQAYVPQNKEIKVLEYSGANSIKCRYKYTSSVVKKLIKLGLKNPAIFDEPLKLFLKGGALHDLIGMLFICSTPNEKEWVARALYNFFEFDWRTDDHLIYGFYTVERKSGYKGLHCDQTLFNPRFDASFSPLDKEVNLDNEDIFNLLDEKDDTIPVLDKLKDYFNIEIQLHTTFENLWSTMEHRNSYNIQAKGKGKNAEISAQWKLLSDNMSNLEMQFEKLQINTEQARFKDPHREGYSFIKSIFEDLGSENNDIYEEYAKIFKRYEDLEELFSAREVSRQNYAEQIQYEIQNIENIALSQSDNSIKILFKLLAAFLTFGLANNNKYFNEYDIQQFVKRSLKAYVDIYVYINSFDNIKHSAVIRIVILLRYLQMSQKYGYGVIDFENNKLVENRNSLVSYTQSFSLFKDAIYIFNNLNQSNLDALKVDNFAYIKMIHRFDILAQDWSLLNNANDSKENKTIADEIGKFRHKYVTPYLYEQLNTLLYTDKIIDISFVINFYSLLVWHNLCAPLEALQKLVQYSAYDKVKTSDIFYYELAAYKNLVHDNCKEDVESTNKTKHFEHYHKNNMIQQLFRIYRDEQIHVFHKARLHFEKLTQTKFKINHFSDSVGT